MRGEELRRRAAAVQALSGGGSGVGWVNLYTKLGQRAAREAREAGRTGEWERERTFCNLPKGSVGTHWREEVNDAAGDEVGAHMSGSFPPPSNPVAIGDGK